MDKNATKTFEEMKAEALKAYDMLIDMGLDKSFKENFEKRFLGNAKSISELNFNNIPIVGVSYGFVPMFKINPRDCFDELKEESKHMGYLPLMVTSHDTNDGDIWHNVPFIPKFQIDTLEDNFIVKDNLAFIITHVLNWSKDIGTCTYQINSGHLLRSA